MPRTTKAPAKKAAQAAKAPRKGSKAAQAAEDTKVAEINAKARALVGLPPKKVEPIPAAAPAVMPDPVGVAHAPTAAKVPDVWRNYHSQVVCVFYRSDSHTHYLAIDGCQLTTQKLSNDEFRREYDRPLPDHTATDFARTWTRDSSAIKMLPISGSALRVLKAILAGQSAGSAADESTTSSLNHLESHMAATEETGFRKPDGPVAKVHAFLDKHIDGVKAGTKSRKELIDALVEKGFSAGTVTTQAGVWARNNGVTFARPTAAAATKKEAKAKAAKKAAKKTPAKKTGKKAAPAEAAAAA
jgi:hypothetical protein